MAADLARLQREQAIIRGDRRLLVIPPAFISVFGRNAANKALPVV